MSEDDESSSSEEDYSPIESDIKFCTKCGTGLSTAEIGDGVSKMLHCEKCNQFKVTLKDPSSNATERLSKIFSQKKRRFKFCFKCGCPVGHSKSSSQAFCSSDDCNVTFTMAATSAMPAMQESQGSSQEKSNPPSESNGAAENSLELSLPTLSLDSREELKEDKQPVTQGITAQLTEDKEPVTQTGALSTEVSTADCNEQQKNSNGSSINVTESANRSGIEVERSTEASAASEVSKYVSKSIDIDTIPSRKRSGSSNNHRGVSQNVDLNADTESGSQQMQGQVTSESNVRSKEDIVVDESSTILTVEETPDSDEVLVTVKGSSSDQDRNQDFDDTDPADMHHMNGASPYHGVTALSNQEDASLLISSTEPVIEALISIVKAVDWKSYATTICLDEYKMREICTVQSESPEECWRKVLQHQFSVEDPSLVILSDIARALHDLNQDYYAHHVKELAAGVRKQLTTPQGIGFTEWSEFCTEDDSIAALMFARPSDKLQGEELRKFVNCKRPRPTVSYGYALVKNCIKVVFNALIPIEAWNWDADSLVHVRFGNLSLGDWRYDCGLFTHTQTHRINTLGKGTVTFAQVRIVFFIPEEIVKSEDHFVYKYVVYTERVFKEEKHNLYWESVNTTKQARGHINRCFSIDPLLHRAHGTYQLYDHIIWPHSDSHGVMSLFSWRSSKKEMTIEENFGITFGLYFKLYNDYFSDNYKATIEFCANDMAFLHSKLCTSWYQSGKDIWPEAVSNPAVVQVTLEWVCHVADTLLKRPDKSPLFKTSKFCCGVTLLLFLKHIRIAIDVKTNASCYKRLLKLIQPSVTQHSSQHRYSEQIDMLMGDTFNDRSALKEILKHVCSFMMKCDEKEWLYGVVILHFLNEEVKPFMPYSDKLRVVQLLQKGQAGLDEKLFRKYMQLSGDPKSVTRIIDMCQPFMEMDALLIWTLLSLCNVTHYSYIMEKYHKSTPVISEHLASYPSVCSQNPEMFASILDLIIHAMTKKTRREQPYPFTHKEYFVISKASIDIITTTLNENLMTCSDAHLNFVSAVLEMFLVANAGMKSHNEMPDAYTSATGGIGNEISKWLSYPSVVGPPFGTGKSSRRDKINTEMKIWKKLSSIPCPDSMKRKWSSILRGVAENRVSKVKSKERLELLTLAQSQTLPEELQQTIGKFVLKDIQTKNKHDLLQDEDYVCHLKSLAEATTGREHSQMILGEYICQEFPERKVTLRSLLTWNMWPTFMMVYGTSSITESDIRSICVQLGKKWSCRDIAKALGQDPSLSDDCSKVVTIWLRAEDNIPKTCKSLADTLSKKLNSEFKFKKVQDKSISLPPSAEVLCESAVQLFRKTCQQLVDKSISLRSMELLNIRSSMKESARTATDILLSMYKHINGRCSGFLPEKEILCNSVKQRLEEFFHLKDMKTKLHLLYDLCSDIAADDCQNIKEMLEMSSSKEMLSELCHTKDHTPHFPCFDLSFEVLSMLQSLQVMNTEYRTEIFSKMWTKKKDEVLKQNTMLSLTDVYHFVWKPIHEDCEAIISGLNSLKIKLSVVTSTFGGMDLDKITEQVKLLVKALSACRAYQNKKPVDEPSDESIRRVGLYNQLCDLRQSIATLNQLRDKLKLTTTDLSSSQVLPNVSQEMELGVIDESVINTELELLKEISEQRKRRRCIESFCDNYELIEWIKQETENLVQLQNLVVIMQRSAAGDDVNDLVTDLRTVVSAFAPLIYEPMDKDATNDELAERCRQLWEALKNTPKMDELLVSCLQNLEMFKYLSDTSAGDVKESTITQMEEYYHNGAYEIGVPDTLVHSVDEVVRLKVAGVRSRNEVISLDKLMDLHGKLVLIAGQQQGTVVDKFLEILHHVQGMSELLVQLHSIGYTKYIGFVVKFRCATVDLQKLESVYEDMKHDLTIWRNKCDRIRTKYPQLNYFTSEQLLYLQKELAALNLVSDNCECPIKLLTLLQSVNLKVNSEFVLYSMKNAKDSIQDLVSPLQLESSIQPQKSLLFEQRLHDLTPYQLELCKELKKSSGFTMGLLIKGLSEISMITADSPINSLREWCSVNAVSDDSGSTSSAELSNFQQNLVAQLEAENISKVLIINGLITNKIKDDPKDLLYKWCIANESEQSDDEDDFMDEDTDAVIESTSLSSVVDDKHPLVLQLIEEYNLETAIKAVRACEENATIESVRKAASLISDGMEVEVQSSSTSKTWVESLAQKYAGSFSLQWGNYQNDFVELDTLGQFLMELSNMSITNTLERQDSICYLNEKICRGCPNLIITEAENMWQTVLSLYYDPDDAPLPQMEQVVICTNETSIEEVTLLWRRAVQRTTHIFCLVHAERLSFGVCEKALQQLDIITQGQRDCMVVIVCAKGCQEYSHILSRLASYERECVNIDPINLKEFIVRNSKICKKEIDVSAASVDDDNLLFGVVYSKRPGMGKSLYIQRLAEKLTENNVEYKCTIARIPIHGPSVSPSAIMRQLTEECSQDPSATHKQIIHLDVSHSVLPSVDSLLFSIIILRGLIDCHGNIWRHQRSQYIVIECTLSDVDFEENKWKSQSGVGDSLYMLLSVFPSKLCISPSECVERCLDNDAPAGIIAMDERIRRGLYFQRVYQYTRRLKANQDLDKFQFDGKIVEAEHDKISSLQALLGLLNIDRKPSWSEISHFLAFLNKQLEDCENSYYCQRSALEEGLPHFKEFVIRFMLQMAMEFTSPSLKVAQAGEEGRTHSDIQAQYEFSQKFTWLNQKHPYLFFNEDQISFTFVGFRISREGHLLDEQSQTIMSKVMHPALYCGLRTYGVNFEENYAQWTTDQMLMKLANVLGCMKGNTLVNPDPTYVLTYDNLMKMLAIHMRFRCNIPVIMMGETGCGKTRLLRYLCQVHASAYDKRVQNLLCLKVHGGVTNDVIKAAVNEARDLAIKNEKYTSGVYTVLFFDEVNTTESLELIKEVMCDRRLNGKPILENIKFAAACNPYRRHKPSMLKKLTSAGLGFYNTKKMQKIGNLKPYQLVYQVSKLPPSMLPLVYDFGQISGETEQKYIKEIVRHNISNSKVVQNTERSGAINVISNVLCWCQEFMRKQEDECSFVSLRDVVRALIVFEWFLEKLTGSDDLLMALIREKEGDIQPLRLLTKALLYSVAVCYHARLSNRGAFEEGITSAFIEPYLIQGGRSRFLEEIERVESVFLESMDVPDNVASNFALRENVFMMVVCIENRLPLFLVGKPGSSKSLAKTVVLNSMLGQQSRNKLLKSFIQVQACPYQCSQYSTAESISEIFEEARKQQDRMQLYSKDSSKFVSVVVLEEVGLAEAAPNFPLKTLHPYLEDGTSGKNLSMLEIEREKRVAFIGISNWALDPAKMNRGIMITRTPPDEDELIMTAKGISHGMMNASHRQYLCTHLFEPLSKMYSALCSAACGRVSQDQLSSCREFFGLRDFYSLIKMVCSICEQNNAIPTWSQLEYAIRRNFSGLANIDPISYIELTILEELKMRCNQESTDTFDCSQLGLIRSSLKSYESADENVTTLYSDNRFLLFITENNSALHILETNLLANKAPFILYGSSFPRDHEYAQVCRNINHIKLQMESGRPVVLLNLENIYESLYDLLNQCYTRLPRGRYIDLGMRSHRIRCRVHEDFRLIIIADHNKVFTTFPSALINRLEKHFVLSSTILDKESYEYAKELSLWAAKFSTVSDSKHKFIEGDAFVGFQSDTVSSIVLHVSELHKRNKLPCKTVENSCKYFLLQMASHDALARLSLSSLGENEEEYEFACSTYFEEQSHSSLSSFLLHYIYPKDSVESVCTVDDKGLLFQVTTYGILLNDEDKRNLASDLKLTERDIQVLMLREFDTEMAFSKKIREFFRNEFNTHRLLIIQCDNGHENIDLIACARYRTKDERNKQQSYGITHVVFVVQLPRMNGGTKFASFQGGPWISAHIDDLHENNTSDIIKHALRSRMSTFFEQFCMKCDESSIFHPVRLLSGCIHKALVQLISAQFSSRAEQLIKIMFQLISGSLDKETMSGTPEIHQQFLRILFKRICELLTEKEDDSYVIKPDQWAVKVALNSSGLRFGYTLVNALAAKVQESLVEILVYFLVRLDTNHNLDLLIINNSSLVTSELWLDIFEHRSILSLQYKELFHYKQSKNVSFYKYRFVGQFPFSNEIITQLDKACSAIPASLSGKIIYKRLCDTLNGHPVGKLLSKISSESEVSSNYCDRYLRDFLSSRALGSNDLTKVLKQTLHCVVSTLEGKGTNLLEDVAAIHVAYQMIKTEMYWFAQLQQHFPDVIYEVPSAEVKVHYSGGEVLLHWDAMNCVFDKLLPTPQSLSSHEQMKEWVNKVYLIKNIAESILSSQAEGSQTKKISIVCKKKWSRIQTVHLLLQHVVIRLPSDLPNFDKRAFRAYKMIADESVTFGDATVLTNILEYVMKPLAKALQKHNLIPELKCAACECKTGIDETLLFPCELKHLVCVKCYDETIRDGYPRCPKCHEHSFVSDKPFLPKPIRIKLQEYSSFQQHCRNFFIEFVSQICFSDLLIDKPGREFVKQLLSIAIAGDSEYYEVLFPINEKEASEYGRKCRIIQSFLLQLLTELRPVDTRELLQEFMTEGKSYVGVEQLIRDDIHLLLLCAKSRERMYFKEYLTKHTLMEKMEYVTDLLKASKKVLCNHLTFKKHRDAIDQDYVDTIARARFGLHIAAEALHDYVYTQNSFLTLRVDQKTSVEQMIVCTKDLCTQSVVKTEVTHFLIKQFVHQYGYQCFMEMSSSDQYRLKSWLLPSQIGKRTDVTRDTDDYDPFMVCGSDYEDLRKKLVYSQDAVVACIEEMEMAKDMLPIAAFYALYKRVCNQVPKCSSSEDRVINVFRNLRHQVQQFELFSEETRRSLCVSCSSTGPPMTAFDFSPRERYIEKYISELVSHSVGVLAQCKRNSLLRILSLPLHCPQDLQRVYLPSMPEEVLDQAVRLLVDETLWECPNGHKYFIGNCGRPWTKTKCPAPNCGAEIGGYLHKASQQTTKIEKESLKFTPYGHILGPCYKRRISADKERNLSAISQSVMRILLHSSYFWALLHCDEDTVQVISESVTPSVSLKELLNYFWHHLEKDLEILSFVLQRNEMDSSLLIHSIIHNMTTIEIDDEGKDYSCSSDKSRKEWETDFSKLFIQPFTDELAKKMNDAHAKVMSDASQGMSEIFRIVSEKDSMAMVDNIDVQVWSYNPTISPALIEEKLTNQDSMPYQLLLEFLRKEKHLTALQFLPDIKDMVTVLDEVCSFRLDRKTAKSVSISMYSKEYLPVEHRQRGFDRLIKSFCEAWNIVKDSLDVPQEFKRQLSSEKAKLDYFIPHKEGAGVCSLQLINFLVKLQNEMIETSWKRADEYGTSNRDYVVPLNKLQRCHVIDHAKHLEHVILSHCSYSLMAGHGTEIEYDFAALERHVLDAFLQGKPCISPSTVPVIMYQNDAQKTSVFQVVRDQVTQVPLSQQDKDEILVEVTEKHQLARTIEVVNTALGFLTVNTWNKNALLFRYAHEVLKLGENVFTSKIKRKCTVAHAISLWKVLCVQQGLTQAISHEDPFPDVDVIFKADLTHEDKKTIDDGLRKCDRNDFLESLYEFITTYVQYLKADDEEHDFGMVERFDDIADMYKIDKITNFDEESFPSSITLSKVVSVWAHAARYYVSNILS